MKPNLSKITINNNLELIKEFINDAVVNPRGVMKKWSLITGQTPAVKIGYVGQHLASLITGVPGTGSGARGDDLIDGSEVKSCNKVDQVDKCNDCGAHIMRYETKCSSCQSTNINRKDDSKWLFSVRDEHELHQYLNLDRILLILMDYPRFDIGDYSSIRISAFEIYPREDRMKVFSNLIKNHYYNIYLPKITGKMKEGLTKGNPMNLHPFGFQFFKCNPILTFSCTIENIDTKPDIIIDDTVYVDPKTERTNDLPSLMMPTHLLKDEELNALLDKADYEHEVAPLLQSDISKKDLYALPKKEKITHLPFIDETLREYIPLREIKAVIQKQHYQR